MSKSVWPSIRNRDQRGTVAITTAMLTPMLVGGLAIGVDTAYWRYRSSVLQSVSDGTAVSLALDIGNGITDVILLQANAQAEANKYGCTSGPNCTVQVTYPYSGNANAVRVVASDTHSKRFFSVIYDVGAKTLQGRSVAARYLSSGSGSGTGTSGSACILALGTGQNGNGIRMQNPLTVDAGCEMFANNNGSQAIYVENGPAVHSIASTRGQIAILNMNGRGGVDHPNPGVAAAIPDPYQTQATASPFLAHSNLPGAPYAAGTCIERLNDPNNPVTLNFGNGSQAANISNAVARGYAFDASSNTHTLNGGGGRFCNTFGLAGTTLNLGPGIWVFSGDVNISGKVNGIQRGLNASQLPTQTVSTALPGVSANTSVDGTTLVWGWQNLNISGATINLLAPSMGPTAGLALSGFRDYGNASGTWEFANGTSMQWGGALYAPNVEVRVQSSAGLFQASIPSGGNSAANGCSQVVARAVTLLNGVSVGNNCSGYGVQPFGTAAGWSGGTPAPVGVKARLRLEAAP